MFGSRSVRCSIVCVSLCASICRLCVSACCSHATMCFAAAYACPSRNKPEPTLAVMVRKNIPRRPPLRQQPPADSVARQALQAMASSSQDASFNDGRWQDLPLVGRSRKRKSGKHARGSRSKPVPVRLRGKQKYDPHKAHRTLRSLLARQCHTASQGSDVSSAEASSFHKPTLPSIGSVYEELKFWKTRARMAEDHLLSAELESQRLRDKCQRQSDEIERLREGGGLHDL